MLSTAVVSPSSFLWSDFLLQSTDLHVALIADFELAFMMKVAVFHDTKKTIFMQIFISFNIF